MILRRLTILVASLAIPAWAGAQQAQTTPTAQAQAATAAQAPPLPPRVGVAGAPLSLTLTDAVRLALERNNDVTIARQ